MSHLDEGTLHALLDGELDLAEVSEIQLHLGSCVACGSRLQEVKQVLAEADRLVGTMEVPAQAPPAQAPPPQRRMSRPSPPPLSQPRDPGIWDEAPVLLVPDPIDSTAWRRRWLRGLGIAATIALVVAGGRFISDALKPGHPVLSDRDLTTATPAVPPAVASSEETSKPQPAIASRERARVPRTPVPTAMAKTAPAASGRMLDSANELKDSGAAASADSISSDSSELASQLADSTAVASATQGSASDSTSQRAQQTRTDSASTRQSTATNRPNPDDLATRAAAAAALAELDRQRRLERANAATAALPPARPEPVAAESAPAPRAPTLEERSQIYLRIGLDEAVRQLGGPTHVIEGMTPQFIGLVRGQQVPGASPRRPVVRVVYLDPRGRMILLDQQRLDPSQAPGATSGNLRWVIGDVMLYLRGEPSQDVLRSLQARVR
jgi:anti-sigma factor RsiW